MTIVIEFEDPIRNFVGLPQYQLFLHPKEYDLMIKANVLAPHHIVAGENEVIEKVLR
jgi:hypothetical protein